MSAPVAPGADLPARIFTLSLTVIDDSVDKQARYFSVLDGCFIVPPQVAGGKSSIDSGSSNCVI
jgi:hypothetical protein